MKTETSTAGVRLVSAVACAFLSLLTARSAAANGGARIYWIDNSGFFNVEDTAYPAPAGAGGYTGLVAGDRIVGLDVRPQNNMLYALGYNSGAGTVRLYTLSVETHPLPSNSPVHQAFPVGNTGTFVAADGVTTVPIAGTNFGFDFEPTTDRARVVNDAGQNFRIDPNTGAFVDGDLGGTPGSIPGVNMDGSIHGATTAVDGAAYTNNQQNAQATTLYTLSAATQRLYIQDPNSGAQSLGLPITLNGNPLNFTGANGFDILPGVNVAVSNAPATGTALALLTTGSGISTDTSLYTIDLSTGAATLFQEKGPNLFGQAMGVRGEVVPGGLPAIALGATNTLVRVNTGMPGAGASQSVSGLLAGQKLVGIDWRPTTGQLMGLGVDAITPDAVTLYRLDPQTGVATVIGSTSPIALNGATAFGFTCEPTTGLMRVVTDTGLNFRIDPSDGGLVGGTLDSSINGLPAGSTGVTGASYTNSFAATSVTTLYTLDPGSNELFIQTPPNSGTQSAGLPVTLNGARLHFDAVLGFDIPGNVLAPANNPSAIGGAYAMLRVGGTSQLYGIDLSAGTATLLGPLTVTGPFAGLAVGEGLPPVPAITLSSSASTAFVNQPVTFTGTVGVVAPVAPPGGTDPFVRFTVDDSATPACQMPPVSPTCRIQFSSAGPHTVVLAYTGDSANRGATSSPVTVNVVQQVVLPTTTTLVAPTTAAGQPLTLTATVTPNSATGQVFFSLAGGFDATLSGGQATLSFPFWPVGTHQVTAQYLGDLFHTASTSAPLTVTVLPGGLAHFFAEGAAGGFFQTDIGVFNVSSTATANVTATLYPEVGAPVVHTFALAPLTRKTLDLNATLGSGQGVSTAISSDSPVATMRQMTWGQPVYGSTLESGIPSMSKIWYFAEGATNVFHLFYLVENPGTTPATLTLTHFVEGGAAPIVETEVVPPSSRRTFYINDVPGLRYAALSTTIQSDVPVIAERAMYISSDTHVFEGGTAGRGATALSQTWSFAEGSTGFFHTYVLLGNPSTTPAPVVVTYTFPNGTKISKNHTVSPQSRLTIDVNVEDPQLASTAVAMDVQSQSPIVAERSIWWGDPFYEGSAELGSTATGTVWGIGEAAEGGANDDATFILVAGQGPTRLTVVYDDGTSDQKDYNWSGRLTVRIADDFPNAIGKRFSVLVESLTVNAGEFTGTFPITVDVARYQSGAGFLAAGGAAAATLIK